MSQTAPHPHDRKAKAAFAKQSKQEQKLEVLQEIEGVRWLMSTFQGRQRVYELLRQGLCLPGQSVSNTNGSLQSYQLGRNDALRPLDELIRQHCNAEWLTMLKENKHDEDTNDD